MLSEIANLHKLCFPDAPWSADEFANLQRGGAQVIASENGFIVWRSSGAETEIITIGVAPNARGAGIATALLHLMEREITSTNHEHESQKIFLEVAADNTAARRMYKKNGYQIIGTRSKYYNGKTDAVVMEKVLQYKTTPLPSLH